MADKVQIMLELEKRGALPADKAAVIGELRKRGAIPSLDAKPGILSRGGFVDRNILSGQLPFAGGLAGGTIGATLGSAAGGIGAVPGGLAGAGLLTGGGTALQNFARERLGLDAPRNISQALSDAGKGIQSGVQSEMLGAIGNKVLSSVGGAISKSIKDKAGSAVQKLATSSVPQSIKEVAKAVEYETPTLGVQMANKGIYGFRKNVLDIAKAGEANFGKQIDDVLSAAQEQRIDPNKIVSELDSIQSRFLRAGKNDAAKIIESRKADFLSNILEKGQTMFKDLEGAVKDGLLSPKAANLLKREFGQEASSVFNKDSVDAVSTVNAEFAESMRKALQKEIEKIAPKMSFLNKEYHFYDELTSALSKGIAKDISKGGITIAQPLTTGGAATAGAFAGGAPGAIAAGGAVQLSRSFPIKTFLAANLAKVAKVGSDKAASEVTANFMSNPTLRNAVVRAITYAANNKSENGYAK